MTRIPGRVMEIRYRRSGKDRGLYKHPFTGRVGMYARADGSILLRGRSRVWADDREAGFSRYTHGRSNPMARRNGGGGGMGLLILGAAALFLLSKKGTAVAAAAPAAAAPAPVYFYSGPTDFGPAPEPEFDYGQSLADTALTASVDVAGNLITDFGTALSAGFSSLIAPTTI